MTKQSKTSLNSSKLEKYSVKKGKTLGQNFSHYPFIKCEEIMITCWRVGFIFCFLLFFCIAFTTQLKENSFDYVSGKREEGKPL